MYRPQGSMCPTRDLRVPMRVPLRVTLRETSRKLGFKGPCTPNSIYFVPKVPI